MSAMLRITRLSRLADLVWPYQIVLDGTAATEIRNSKSIQIPVTAGTHTLQIRSLHIVNRLLGLASPTITFEIDDDETASFVCQPGAFVKILGRWTACLTGDRTQWISIEQVSVVA
jgi:hypothetical protein